MVITITPKLELLNMKLGTELEELNPKQFIELIRLIITILSKHLYRKDLFLGIEFDDENKKYYTFCTSYDSIYSNYEGIGETMEDALCHTIWELLESKVVSESQIIDILQPNKEIQPSQS